MISLWTWNDSNGSATKEETMAAYSAVTNQGSVSNFSYKVWNDLVDKINEIILSIKPEWITTYGTYLNTRMSDADKELTANRFNAAVTNTYYMWWSWTTDHSSPGYTGRKEFHGTARYGNNSDKVYGQYFLELAERMNTMIHIINDDEYAKDATVSIADQIACIAEFEALKVAAFSVEEIQSSGSIAIFSDVRSLSQETVGRLELYFAAELELYDNRSGMTAFIVDVLNALARMRALQARAFETDITSPITSSSEVNALEPSSMSFNSPMEIIGEYVLHAFGSNAMKTNNHDEIINISEANRFVSDPLNAVTHLEENGERTMHLPKATSFGNNETAQLITNESMMTLINIYQAFMVSSIVLTISETCELFMLLSESLEVDDDASVITSSLMEALIDPESINVNVNSISSAVAVFELMGIIPIMVNTIQSCGSDALFELLSPIAFEGSAHADMHAGGSMEMQYTKLVYATALLEIMVLMQQVLEVVQPKPLEQECDINVAFDPLMDYLTAASMEALMQINLSFSASANGFNSRRLQSSIGMRNDLSASMDIEMIKRFRSAVFIGLLMNAVFDVQRSLGMTAIGEHEISHSSTLELFDNFVRAACNVIMMVATSSNLELIHSVDGMNAEMVGSILSSLLGELLPTANLGNVQTDVNLYVVPSLESKILAPMHVELAMVMACVANLDFEASWDYPDLIGNVLYVRQVKKMEQIYNTLYLDAEDTVVGTIMTLVPNVFIDGYHTIEGICRVIYFHVDETGTLSLATKYKWIYPIHKGNAELSVRQVKSANKIGETLEVS